MFQDTINDSTINDSTINDSTINEQDNELLNFIEEKNFKELFKLTLPFLNSEIRFVRQASYDFCILLEFAFNPSNDPILLFLNEAIEHVIEYFTPEMMKLLNNSINIEYYANYVHYDLLNDIIKVLKEQLIFQNKSEDIKDFLLQI